MTAVQTGLAYDVGELSPNSQKNAAEGLRNDKMSMIRCYERDDDFHFELQERIRVTIPDEGAPTCSTCRDDQGRACRHIWWVDDQILSAVIPEQARPHFQYQVSRDGQAVRRADEQEPWMFHGLLEEGGLERLARLGGWWKQDPMVQQDVREVEETATRILSTFEPCGVLSKQHGQDNFEMLQQESQYVFLCYISLTCRLTFWQGTLCTIQERSDQTGPVSAIPAHRSRRSSPRSFASPSASHQDPQPHRAHLLRLRTLDGDAHARRQQSRSHFRGSPR